MTAWEVLSADMSPYEAGTFWLLRGKHNTQHIWLLCPRGDGWTAQYLPNGCAQEEGFPLTAHGRRVAEKKMREHMKNPGAPFSRVNHHPSTYVGWRRARIFSFCSKGEDL